MKKVFLFSFFICITVLLCCCSPMKTLYCGTDKTDPVLVTTNINKVYPVHSKAFKSNLKVALKVAKVDISNVEIGFQDTVIQYRNRLSNEYALIQDLLKIYYLAYIMRPCQCDTELRDKFFGALDIISENIGALSTYTSSAKASPAQKSETHFPALALEENLQMASPQKKCFFRKIFLPARSVGGRQVAKLSASDRRRNFENLRQNYQFLTK